MDRDELFRYKLIMDGKGEEEELYIARKVMRSEKRRITRSIEGSGDSANLKLELYNGERNKNCKVIKY